MNLTAHAEVTGAFTPSDDAYVSSTSSTTNFDGQLLSIERAGGISGDDVTQLAFLKFDLTGQTEEITTATFTLAPVLGACVGGDWDTTVTLDVYGVSIDSWAEGTITWDSADTAGMMNSGNLTLLGTASYDSGTGYYSLIHPDQVAWLEAERTGDSTATYLVQLSPSQPLNSTFFEDSELTGTGVPSCTVPSPAQPLIDLGSAPLAVSISEAESVSGNHSWVAWLALMFVLMFIVGVTAVFQNQQNKN